MRATRSSWVALLAGFCLAGGALVVLPEPPRPAPGPKEPPTPEQPKPQVSVGGLLFHGDAETEQRLGVTLSKTGWACAMCHPYASDTHPAQFPKWQEQMSKFATLRDMINWCIEKPNEGEAIDPDGPAMKALEAYITWSNRNSPLQPGVH